MNALPIPELAIVAIVCVVMLALRAVLRVTPVPFAPRPDDFRPSRAAMPLERLRARLIATCVIFALISVPLILKLVPPNGVYGFRTSITRASDANWYQANLFSGLALLTAAAASAALLVAIPARTPRWAVWSAYLLPVGAAVIASFLYLSRLA